HRAVPVRACAVFCHISAGGLMRATHLSGGRNDRRRYAKRLCARAEQLESRRLLSVTSTFELDGNVTTSTSHDWDQVFADNQTNPVGASSGAVASSFVTDKVNSNTDDIFQGGGSKDTLGIQSGRWLF